MWNNYTYIQSHIAFYFIFYLFGIMSNIASSYKIGKWLSPAKFKKKKKKKQ